MTKLKVPRSIIRFKRLHHATGPDKSVQDLIGIELIQWVHPEGFFRLDVAKRAHGKVAPGKTTYLYFIYFILFEK